VIVKGADTLGGRTVEIAADLVVLSTAVVPRATNRQVAEMIGLSVDDNGFYTACDEELDPVSSPVPGIYFAGAALGPKDIPETVAQASAAAAKVLGRFKKQSAISGQLSALC
jgi:heterodisulfide reductase subunit A